MADKPEIEEMQELKNISAEALRALANKEGAALIEVDMVVNDGWCVAYLKFGGGRHELGRILYSRNHSTELKDAWIRTVLLMVKQLHQDSERFEEALKGELKA